VKKRTQRFMLWFTVVGALVFFLNCRSGSPGPGEPGLGAAVAPAAVVKPAEKFVMLFATGVSGELVDCGCPGHPRGGLARRAEVARGLADANPGHFLNLDAGNSFFAMTPPAVPGDDKKQQARVMAKSLSYMGVNAINVGPMDLAAGLPFLRDELARAGASELPFISANLTDPATGKPLFPAYREFKIGERNVCVLGLTQPVGMDGAVAVADPAASLKATVGELESKCDLIVGLFAMPIHAASELARQSPGVDIIIISDRSSAPAPRPLVLGDTAIFQAGARGMYLGRLDLTLLPTKPATGAGISGEERAKVEAELARVVAQVKMLEGDIVNDPQLAGVYKKAKAEEKALREKLGQSSAGYDFENALISLDITMPEDRQVAAWVAETGVKPRTPVTPTLEPPTAPAH